MSGESEKGRRRIPSQTPPAGGWQVVYSGFVLILLCFFIMLSSFATMEKAKVLQFVKSFVGSVSVLPGGTKLSAGEKVLPESGDIVQINSELAMLFEEIQQWMEGKNLNRHLTLHMTSEGLALRFSDSLVFDVGSADLKPSAKAVLEDIAEIVRRSRFDVRIEGHTDNLPIRNRRFPSNWELSTARAVNVLRFFTEEKQLSSDRLTAVGFGEFRPLESNDTPDRRAMNRRVEVIFFKTPEAGAPERARMTGRYEKAPAA